MGSNSRLKIGLIFNYDDNWIGGSYYIINIINALNFLEDHKKPILQIICNSKDYTNLIKKIDYPYFEFINIQGYLSTPKRIINAVLRRLKYNPIFSPDYKFNNVEFVFPCPSDQKYFGIKHKVFWIPDFQDRHLPHFFNENELFLRKEFQNFISKQQDIIFSSKNALADFNSYFPNSNIKRHVYNFCSILPKVENLSLNSVQKKYQLNSDEYYFSPNQFWQHKNQIVILKAIKKIKEQGVLQFKVYFSGKTFDYRNPEYFSYLEEFVEKNELQDNIKFLGFINREDQICLMKHSIAIIQPSLFEGWSTVIEDAKSMNKNIIVSNIPVHIEQLGSSAFYFNHDDEQDLANQMQALLNKVRSEFDYNYDEVIKKCANNFIDIFNSIKKTDSTSLE